MNRTERALVTLEGLRNAIPSPQTELHYNNEYELIIAVVLSAQCTDERVNKVTPALFEAFPTVESLAKAEPEEIFPYIRSVSYPNNKSKHLAGLGRMVIEQFEGQIPRDLKALVKLPGVGRKTAQVVASVAFEIDALPVDTHVFRVANRIGLARNADTPLKVEKQLKALLAKEDWSEAHHLLILHGRYTCLARKPACERCPITSACTYYEKLQKLPADITGLSSKKGKYYCKTGKHYFDEPAQRTDRYGVAQIACPTHDSMNIFESKTGKTTRRVRDYRV